jgi:hypothetical protein
MARLKQIMTMAIVFGPMLAACGDLDENSPQGEGQAGTEDTSTVTRPIWGPDVRGRAAISLDGGRCSGVLLNSRVFLTSAHCVRTVTETIVLGYQSPTGGGTWTRTVDYFVHPNYNSNSPAEWDIAVGTLSVALTGLSTDDFATIRRNGGLGGGRHVTQAGYGGSLTGPSGVQRRIDLKVTWNGPHHAKWETAVSAGEAACSGDSGGPGFRGSGYFDGLGFPKWDAVAWLMKGTLSGGNAPPGVGICDDDGRATYIHDKVDWIKGLVEAVTPWVCVDFTNPNGEPAAWCWG